MKLRSTTVILASLVATAASAAIGPAVPADGFHVTPTGLDSNPGTVAKSFVNEVLVPW